MLFLEKDVIAWYDKAGKEITFEEFEELEAAEAGISTADPVVETAKPPVSTSNPGVSTPDPVNEKKSGLVKVRDKISLSQDKSFDDDGYYIGSEKITSKGRAVLIDIRDRHKSPRFLSQFESESAKFKPVYGSQQLFEKRNHVFEIERKLGSTQTFAEFNKLPNSEIWLRGLKIKERLLQHPDTQLLKSVMAQGREPVFLLHNNGNGTYPIKDHIATFERRPELGSSNFYITDYVINFDQVKDLYSNDQIVIDYTDLLGNPQTNIGHIFGKNKGNITNGNITDAPTLVPTENTNVEL